MNEPKLLGEDVTLVMIRSHLEKIERRQDQLMNEMPRYRNALQGLEAKLEDNMQRLNKMMLELKGLIAMVRPAAAKNDWYKGEEIPVNVNLPAPLSPKNPFRDNCSMETIDGKQHINTSNGITFIEQ